MQLIPTGQPLSANLTSIAALSSVTAAGLALLDDAAASNQRTTLGLGTSDAVQLGTLGLGAALTAASGIGTPRFGVTTGSWSEFNSSRPAMVQFQRDFTEPPDSSPGAVQDVFRVYMSSHQSGTVAQGRVGFTSHAADSASVTNKTITNAVSNGGPDLIRITATAHGYATSDRINIYGVGGTTEANGVWTITVIDANTFDLQGSTHTNAYTSGGTATNRGLLYAIRARVAPTLDRGGLAGTGLNGDDVNGVVVDNSGAGKATEGYYIRGTGSTGGGDPAWYANFSGDDAADYGLLLAGEYRVGAGIYVHNDLTTDDTATTTYRSAYFNPAINFGGSNTNKTLNVVEIDTTNTSVTGLSTANTNLIKASYGASQRFAVDAAGLLSLTGRAVVASGTLTASAPGIALTQTWNSGGTEFKGLTVDITDTASASTSKLFDVMMGSASRLSLNNNGVLLNIAKDGVLAAVNGISHGGGSAGSPAAANTTVVNNLGWVSSGTAATPIRTQTGQVAMRIGGSGYLAADDSTTASIVAGHKAAIDFITGANDWTASDNGMYIRFRTTPDGSTTVANRVYINDKGLSIGATTAARGTTEPTNALNIFDGTAPVGTLTNGVSLHSATGKLKSVDAAGLAGWVVSASAANTVSPTAPNRTLTVEVNGTTYYIHAKTTND